MDATATKCEARTNVLHVCLRFGAGDITVSRLIDFNERTDATTLLKLILEKHSAIWASGLYGFGQKDEGRIYIDREVVAEWQDDTLSAGVEPDVVQVSQKISDAEDVHDDENWDILHDHRLTV